jgi:hypothetical protein
MYSPQQDWRALAAEDRTSKGDAAGARPHPATPKAYTNGERFERNQSPVPVSQPDVVSSGELKTSTKAIAAFVLSIAGLIVLPLVCSTLAIVFAVIGRKEIDADPRLTGRGLATAGLMIGIVGLVLAAIALVVILATR